MKPLGWTEYRFHIYIWVRRRPLSELGTDRDGAVVMLHLELGHNPNASARLRNKDFVRFETNAAAAYQVEVPRVKKRTSRRETRSRPISATLGACWKDCSRRFRCSVTSLALADQPGRNHLPDNAALCPGGEPALTENPPAAGDQPETVSVLDRNSYGRGRCLDVPHRTSQRSLTTPTLRTFAYTSKRSLRLPIRLRRLPMTCWRPLCGRFQGTMIDSIGS